MTHTDVVAYKIDDACKVLGVGRTSIYRLINASAIKPIHIAGRTLIPRREIERLVAEAFGEEAA